MWPDIKNIFWILRRAFSIFFLYPTYYCNKILNLLPFEEAIDMTVDLLKI